MQIEYDRNVLILDGAICKIMASGVKVLISCKVVYNGNARNLEISACDVKSNYWELDLTYSDFCGHLEQLGLMMTDWKTFFNMMRESFNQKLIMGEINNKELKIFVDYPMGEAKLRGTFNLKHIKNTAPQLLADFVFAYIEKIEAMSLKRPREPSPQAKIKVPVAEPIRTKPKIVKKKKPKQIGSKII